MKNLLLLCIAAITIASCDNKPKGLASFDACSCATVQDMNSEDFKKCKTLRDADAKFEADYDKCRMAQASGVADTSKVSFQNAANATNLKAASEGTYSFDAAKSTITWIGQKVTGKRHTGTLNIKGGSITMEGSNIKAGEITIDMNSIVDTDQSGEGKAKLEGHLKSEDFFNVAKFPEATFVITSAKAINAIQYEAMGKLTIKGITKDVKCNLVIAPNGTDAVNVGGGFQFDRTEFDVRYGSDKFFDNLGNDMINNEIILTVNLKAKKMVA